VPPIDDTVVGRMPVVAVGPIVESGLLPAKAVVGEAVTLTATVFREGHDAVAAGVVTTGPDGVDRPLVPLRLTGVGTDRWAAVIRPDQAGDWTFRVEAWSDVYGTWTHDAPIKIAADVDTELMLSEGAKLLGDEAGRSSGSRASVLRGAADTLLDTSRPTQVRLAAGLDTEVRDELARTPIRELVTASRPHPLRVDRVRALVGSWYEFFPRSIGAHENPDGSWTSGTFATAAEHLSYVAGLGFDVVYLPPIHPIGRINRKGANNTLDPGPNDPGSPWGIGSVEGGHDAIHPDLGTLEDFDAFVARARELDIEVAIDLALQAAPDHPWVSAHPEWFTTRVDGSIAYAENPPKKYQDIYPINFDNDPDGIYNECLRVVRHWIDHGVTIFRVDNPHTKPVRFWEWLLAIIRAERPDVIFLAEAFTRPAMMHTLGKIGFHQSYTYFTWRNEKWEIEQYLEELAHESADYFRPNFFTNTQDILTAFLQYGGPSAFTIRAVLAAMASPTYGIYSGFELFEHVALRPGSEEYLDSEKYQYRPRDLAGALERGEGLGVLLRRLNEIRRDHPALRQLRNLTVHSTGDDHVLAFSKSETAPDGRPTDTVLVVLSLDPHGTRETSVRLDLPALGYGWEDTIVVDELLTGQTWHWRQDNYVRLDPSQPAHICVVRPAAGQDGSATTEGRA
jgi:starch synthase (maltosyl-transferring)